MKNILAVVVLLPMWALHAQPLNGSFTIGGTSPNFATPQAAANALKTRGVSGPSTFNIRPGIYMENGGASRVMLLDSVIAGLSATNRITFQPDAASGGNVDNVILQVDQTTQNGVAVAEVKIDFFTLRNMTFRDADSGQAGAEYLLRVTRFFPSNLTIEGIVIEGCKFLGNPVNTDSANMGTDYGVYGDNTVNDAQIRGNTFHRLLRAISIGFEGSGIGSSSVTVEDNNVLAGHSGRLAFGTGIAVHARNASIRRNIIDNAGSRGQEEGIRVLADTGIVERNHVKNNGQLASVVGENFDFEGIKVDGLGFGDARVMTVVNNMISGNYCGGGGRIGINVQTRRAKIIHNTIVHPTKLQVSRGISLENGADSCTLLNNIVIEYGIRNIGLVAPLIVFDQQSDTAGLVSDYNVFFWADPGGLVVRRGNALFSTLAAYQAATRLDSHSIAKEVDFVFGQLDPHLSDCQAQDVGFVGIPIPGVVDDFDGDVRSLTAPFRGADEGRLRAPAMFGATHRISLPGTPLSIAAGRFDNPTLDGLAVPDYDNRRVYLFHNNGPTRTFSLSNTLNTGFRPNVVKFFDMDVDGNLDLIVGGDTTAVTVYWGNGTGGFPTSNTIGTFGGVVSLEPIFISTVAITETRDAFSARSFLGFLQRKSSSLDPRILCHNVLMRTEGIFSVVDTIPTTMYDIATGDLNQDGIGDAFAIGLGPVGTPYALFDTFIPGVVIGGEPCSFAFSANHVVSQSSSGPNGGHTSNIAMGRFDGDTDLDIVTTGASLTQTIFYRNQGNLNFSAEPIAVNGAIGLASLDYEGDGDLDFVTVNRFLEDNGVTVFLNDGTGHFTFELNCFQRFANGTPFGVVASDFDLDGKTDLAIASSYDTVFVLYNFGNVTSIGNESSPQTPTTFSLSQNYPNPFNPSTRIEYALPVPSHVSIKIYNLLGQEITSLVDEEQQGGHHATEWNGRSTNGLAISSSVYFYRIEVRAPDGQLSFANVKKLVLLK